MTPETLIVVSLALPLAALAWIVIFGKFPNVRESGTVVLATLLFGSVVWLSRYVFAGQTLAWEVGEMLPGFRIAFSLEPLGLLFALVASGLWIPTTFYAIGYMRSHQEPNQTRFFACFAVAIFAALAAAFSANLFTLFVAYELMTISTYPLVTHQGDTAARNGGRVYLGILLASSIGLFMLAIGWTWFVAGTLDFRVGGILAEAYEAERISQTQLAILFGLFAYGIGKAALMPLHRWLPAAMVAPTPVSALLHAVAVVKAGAFGILRIIHDVFGVHFAAAEGLLLPVAVLAGITIIYGSVRALGQEDLKRRLAYSTVSQVSYIVLGAAILGPAATIGSLIHLVHQGLMKITLFFCAGNIAETVGLHKVGEMAGLGRRMPWTMGAFTIAALGMIGVPPLAGFTSKWYLGIGGMDAGQPWVVALLVVSTLLNAAYFLPLIYSAWFREQEREFERHRVSRWETPWPLLLPTVASALLVILVGLFANSPFSPLELARQIAEQTYFER